MKKIIAATLVTAVVILSGLGCKDRREQYTVSLDVWGTFDNSGSYDGVFHAYRSSNPSVQNIQYRKIDLESYKKDVLNGLAAGNGPDVFMIHNSWMPEFLDKIVPVPTDIMTEQDFRDNFVDVVAQDAIVDGRIYGVPLSVDSLALYYNKDIFNAAGITRPPQTWDEFDKVVQALTIVDDYGNITQSGVAMGTAYNVNGAINVNRAPDILTVLMMQNGAEMSNRESKTVTFGDVGMRVGGTPALSALQYYTDFASSQSPNYTWNKMQNYSIDMFFEGRAAMMINYSYHYDTIRAKNAKLNFAVADLPQKTTVVDGSQANFANYWLFVVAKNKDIARSSGSGAVPVTNDMRVHESWQMLRAISFPSAQGVTLRNYFGKNKLVYPVEYDLTEKYLEQSGKPAARRDIVERQKSDVKLGAFARGNLIARSWWRRNADAVDGVFYDMIDRVNTGQSTASTALATGFSRASALQ